MAWQAHSVHGTTHFSLRMHIIEGFLPCRYGKVMVQILFQWFTIVKSMCINGISITNLFPHKGT